MFTWRRRLPRRLNWQSTNNAYTWVAYYCFTPLNAWILYTLRIKTLSNPIISLLSRSHLAGLGEAIGLAGGAVGAAAKLGGLRAIRVTLEEIAGLSRVLARVADGAGVAVVGVDLRHVSYEGLFRKRKG